MKYSKKIQVLLQKGREDLLGRERFDVKKYQLSKNDIPELLKMAFDEELHESDDDLLWYAPYYALYALMQFKSIEPLGFLLNLLPENIENDFMREAAIDYIVKLEDLSFNDVEEVLLDEEYASDSKITILDGLSDIARNTQRFNAQIVDIVTKTVDTQELCSGANAFAVMVLVDAGGAKNIEKIREIFQTGDVDDLVMGDVEDVEIKLGLREKRESEKEATVFDNMFGNMLDSIDEDFVQNIPTKKPARNEPCPCGSGKKYKKCCI